MPATTKPKRPRGAQPANVNALKHGFYSKHFDQNETTDLDTLLTEGLQDEIAMLRVITRRVFKIAQGDQDLDQMTNLLGALGMASTRLAGLLKTQKLLTGDDSNTARAISSALSDIVKELGIK